MDVPFTGTAQRLLRIWVTLFGAEGAELSGALAQ
jgi:hypothetical protein